MSTHSYRLYFLNARRKQWPINFNLTSPSYQNTTSVFLFFFFLLFLLCNIKLSLFAFSFSFTSFLHFLTPNFLFCELPYRGWGLKPAHESRCSQRVLSCHILLFYSFVLKFNNSIFFVRLWSFLVSKFVVVSCL